MMTEARADLTCWLESITKSWRVEKTLMATLNNLNGMPPMTTKHFRQISGMAVQTKVFLFSRLLCHLAAYA